MRFTSTGRPDDRRHGGSKVDSASTSESQGEFWRDRLIGSEQVLNSKEDALTDRLFQLLLEGARRLEEPYTSLARFVIFATGRLGMRAGEVTHMSEDWVDWREKVIRIPAFDRCEKGRTDDGPCGYCRRLAHSIAEHNEELTVEQALSTRWSPKTAAGARAIPFDFDIRVEMEIERLFEDLNSYPHCRGSITQRVTDAAEVADGLDSDRVYPHALRATASTFHASRGLTGLPLQSFMGWEKLATTETYLNGTAEATRRALRSVHPSR
ncbi:tyrosine-type recombinase/integrase [Halobium palmae]|uniref:Tyrosine-type recombinase/integrase n=1 Tax=Halobium palmae TaxID=1776492 RepID=A0ABD5RTZ4_9EURY